MKYWPHPQLDEMFEKFSIELRLLNALDNFFTEICMYKLAREVFKFSQSREVNERSWRKPQ